ncbi:MAG: FAD-dependent oxidoreductase [Pirellulaceae bacterium]
MQYRALIAVVLALPTWSPADENPAEPLAVRQSARAIPIVADVDVLVVGGSTGAVAAASEAARSGAKVFLVTNYPYLGEDLCATLRLWLESAEKPNSPLAKRLFATTPARPMHVKRILDQALLDAGVGFLFGCYATDVLRNAQGQVAGLVMANRAGRQAIKAKILIDATERAAVARMAGATFHPYPGGDAEFHRVVVGAAQEAGQKVHVRRLDCDWFGEERQTPAFEYTLVIPMQDGSYASFAKAEQQARDLTFHKQQLDSAERLFQVPPDAVESEAGMNSSWDGADHVDLNVFRPRSLARLYVLGGCAAVSRQSARQLLRPIALIDAGARVGQEAAREAISLPCTGEARVAGDLVPNVPCGDVFESLVGVRPIQQDLPTIHSPERGLPALGRYDVVVIGGGTSGAAAGIGAARHGAKTLVVEYQHGLGGVGTLGLIGKYWHGLRSGFTSEVDRGVSRLDAKVVVVGKAEWWRQELLRAGAEIWFGALGCGAVVDQGRVCGVAIATPEGRGVVLAKVVIDATGNADVAAAAGAPCAYVDDSDISMQVAGLPARSLGSSYVNTCYMFTDDTDIVDLSQLLVYAKDRFRDAYDLSTLVDTRERRRIMGDCVLTPIDLHAGRTWPDTISVHASNYDMYGFPVHPLYLLAAPPKRQVIRSYLPYRCLLPKGLEGLLVVGIGLSADRDAMPSIRMQADMQNLGYAAGIAAAMTAQTEKSLRAIDVRAMQERLVEMGNLPAEVLAHCDSFPASEQSLAAAIGASFDNLNHLAIVLANADAALPRVREAYCHTPSEPARLDYARLLAFLGDDTGLDTLLAALERSSWDTGHDIETSGESGSNYSPVDMLILAVGRTGDRRAVEPIVSKARQLEPAAGSLSHFRAVAVALETIGERTAAPALAELLRKPGMTGHAITTLPEARRKRGEEEKGQGRTVQRINLAVRELVLARALYRCGDERGMAIDILRRYEQDLQGPFARHAHAVMSSRQKSTDKTTTGEAIPGGAVREFTPPADGPAVLHLRTRP